MFSNVTKSVIITGAGHYIPEVVKTNEEFKSHTFYNNEEDTRSSREMLSCLLL